VEEEVVRQKGPIEANRDGKLGDNGKTSRGEKSFKLEPRCKLAKKWRNMESQQANLGSGVRGGGLSSKA